MSIKVLNQHGSIVEEVCWKANQEKKWSSDISTKSAGAVFMQKLESKICLDHT